MAWFALFRVLLGAVYMLYRSATDTWEPEYEAIRDVDEENHPMGYLSPQNPVFGPYNPTGSPPPQTRPKKFGLFSTFWPSASDVRSYKLIAFKTSSARNPWAPLNRDITFLGWGGWLWTGLYAPISQVLWVAANVTNHSNGAVKIVKGLSVAVTALPLCIDARVRYGEALAKPGRVWPKYAFNIVNGMSCLVQGVLCAVLLVTGVVDLEHSDSGFPLPLVAIYPVMAFLSMVGSLKVLPIRDGGPGTAAQQHWYRYFIDVGVGAFAGLFLAAPAFALWRSASFNEKYIDRHGSGSISIGVNGLVEYLKCETDVWRKLTAILP